jgi:hypothetical protein
VPLRNLSVRPHVCTPGAPLASGSGAAFPGHKPAEQGLSGAVSQPYDVWSKTTTGAQSTIRRAACTY